MSPLDFDALRRRPDVEAPELRAWDAADRLILDQAAPQLRGREAVVIGDSYGALTLGALDLGASAVRVHQDPLSGELALRANGAGCFTSLPFGSELVAGSGLVLLRLPRALDALEDICALVAAHASPDMVMIAGGRIKHMSLGMNEVLARHFSRVDVSPARQKSRLLIARGPVPGAPPEPQRQFHADIDLWVCAIGGAFAGTSIDIGTRALLSVLDRAPAVETAIDLGCGTGILAAVLARANPAARVIASDQSAAAVASARATMRANDLDVEVVRDLGLQTQPDRSADLVLLNPPFHVAAAVHSGIARPLFDEAARVLRPGGELWCVWNSHLGYRPTLERTVGPTRQLARTPKFTVTASVRR